MPDADIQDDSKEVSGTAPTLDQVHAMNQAKVEAEDLDNEEQDNGEADVDESTVDNSNESSDKDEVIDTPVDDKPADTVEEVTPPKPALELDTDKPGEGKVSILDAEGKRHYFNNLDEVPDTFEPASYKELMLGTRALMQKEESDAQAAKDAEKTATQRAHKEATDAMQQGWEKDATELSEMGVMPKDAKKLEKAKEEVYDYIESEMKQGNIITSFKQAFKGLMYDKQQIKVAKEQKDIDDMKKKRGDMVQPGSGGGTPTDGSKRGRVIAAPAAHAGLDAVHAHTLANL